MVGRAALAHHARPDRPRGRDEERAVHFDQRIEGPYQIYAGALEAPQGDGYIAAVVVVANANASGATRPREAWRDDSLACGHRWASPGDALLYAIERAREVIHKHSRLLAC
jgi:hypothetical protein